MKFSASLTASDTRRTVNIDTQSDFDMSDEEWNELSDREKQEKMNDFAGSLFEQPYWYCESFDED